MVKTFGWVKRPHLHPTYTYTSGTVVILMCVKSELYYSHYMPSLSFSDTELL